MRSSREALPRRLFPDDSSFCLSLALVAADAEPEDGRFRPFVPLLSLAWSFITWADGTTASMKSSV